MSPTNYVANYDLQFGRPVTVVEFITGVANSTKLPNLDRLRSIDGDFNLTYYLNQIVREEPKKVKGLPEGYGPARDVLMQVEPVITPERKREILQRNEVESMSPSYNESEFLDGLTYDRLKIQVTEKGAKTITPDLIQQVKNELEGK